MGNYGGCSTICVWLMMIMMIIAGVNSVTVSQDGRGDYRTIGEAIAAAPSYSEIKYRINVRSGIYKEHIMIPHDKTNIFLVGDGRHYTRIVGRRSTSLSSHYTLASTATIAIDGAGFVGLGIAFVNTAGPKAGRGIALLNTADESAFYNCSFEGFQDTLWAASGRQFYRECHVYGSVDFIMGNAAAVFQKSTLYARFYPKLLLYTPLVFTAQSRNDMKQPTGFVFQYCRFTVSPRNASRELSGAGGAILGRPWREYSRVVILQSFMDSIVCARGWGDMENTPTDKVSYIEFKNEGPGSSTRGRVRWPGVIDVHDEKQVGLFAVSQFLKGDDWIPTTGVPYLGGIL